MSASGGGAPWHTLSKLRSRSVGELGGRLSQFVASQVERMGPAPSVPVGRALAELLEPASAGVVDTRGLLAAFRHRDRPRFFASFEDRAATVRAVDAAAKGARARTVEAADRICDGRFDLLGLRELDFGHPPNWHLDPTTGRCSPMVHWARIRYLDPRVVGDHKVVWELNRHQYFAVLGRAYWLTGDERYATTFASHIASWMASNPPKLGVNWASSLEVAFRTISWIWALHFFRSSPALTPQLFERILGSLYVHARHIERYLSTWFSPNTHLTGEALGLFYVGTLFPEFRRAPRWRQLGRRILQEQLSAQVRADGVYFEQATYYHRYTVDFYTHMLVLLEANGLECPAPLRGKLTALLDHLMALTRPDGRSPLIGDDDGGRLVLLDERPQDDFRAALSTGAVLFGRTDYAYVAGPLAEETVWLVGPRAAREFDRLEAKPPAATSRGFIDSGVFVMRDGWTPAAQFAVIDCGPHGALSGGHSHADALSVELAADGVSWLVDPGTFSYTASPSDRRHFRHSASHSTVTVDGEPSSVPDGPFSWRHVADCRPREWITHERFDYLAGEHDGFRRLPEPVSCARSVLYLKGRYWVVRDSLASHGEHTVGVHFQCGPDAVAQVVRPSEVILRARDDRATLRVAAFGGTPAGRFSVGSGWVSRAYGARTAAPALTFTQPGVTAADIITVLLPASTVLVNAHVSYREGTDARRLAIADDEITDVLLFDGRLDSREDQVCAEASQLWLRRERNGAAEFVMIDGKALVVDGEAIVERQTRARFVTGRRVSGRWSIEIGDSTSGARS